MSQRLGVNVDHVATLRQARQVNYPDPVAAAVIAELAGAGQITIHLREDRRHIQDRDLRLLRSTVQTLLNLEMASTQEMLNIAYEYKPDVVTLVPERREELTTEGGLDVMSQREMLTRYVKTLHDGDMTVSLFIDPDIEQIRAAHKCNTDRVELHTGRYCEAATETEKKKELYRIIDAAKTATKLGMGCAAGHGLNYDNVVPIAQIEEIDELNIGHSIVARAVLVGMDVAIRDMLSLMRRR